MKRMFAGALALAALTTAAASGAAQAQPYGPNREVRDARQDLRDARHDLRDAQRRQAAHRWRQGQRLDRRYGDYAEVNDWRARRLPPPRRGYHWVRSGDDYVQAALVGGLIASVIAATR
jgi:Ni/Co efflux regulator RcnB